MSDLRHDESGFTIAELIVTLIVGAIFVVAINAVFTTQTYISQRGRSVVLANAYAEKKIEALRSKGFLGLSNGTTSVTNELPSELLGPKSADLTVSSHSPAIKKVELTITFNDGGSPRTYKYASYIGELGVGQY